MSWLSVKASYSDCPVIITCVGTAHGRGPTHDFALYKESKDPRRKLRAILNLFRVVAH
jgi:hypothetical protein